MNFIQPTQLLNLLGVIELAKFHKNWLHETKKAWRFFGLNPTPFTEDKMQAMENQELLSNVNPHNTAKEHLTLESIPPDRAAAFDLLDEFFRPFNEVFYNTMLKYGVNGGRDFTRWRSWRESFTQEIAEPKQQRDIEMIPGGGIPGRKK